MPQGKACKLLQPQSCDNKKPKRKNGKKSAASSASPQNTEKPQTVSLPPETSTVSLLPPQSPGLRTKLRTSSKKDGGCFVGSGQRRIKHLKDSRAPQSGALSQECVPELSAKESLRWEGVLEDPQAEEKRLELYRAKRRQRYIAHREALLKETQSSLKKS